ncbi:parathyroid hormone 1b [Hoplias malabaricus]|uniref:parathyroid hormone 1b n=1 Tax=Hoplias malabaricus TaxID=27720 RepID=UPI003461BBC9
MHVSYQGYYRGVDRMSGLRCAALGMFDTQHMFGVQPCGAEQSNVLNVTANTVFSVRAMDRRVLVVLLWSLSSLLHLEGFPISKRSISEVQLMHNVGEHKQVLERQDWLQVKLKSILIPSINESQKGQKGKMRTVFPDILTAGKVQSGS